MARGHLCNGWTQVLCRRRHLGRAKDSVSSSMWPSTVNIPPCGRQHEVLKYPTAISSSPEYPGDFDPPPVSYNEHIRDSFVQRPP